MSTFDNSCLGACSPIQILNIEMAVNDGADVKIFDKCDNPYDVTQLKYSYSTDGLCWSCYMSYDELVENTVNDISDFFIRIKVPGEITTVNVNGEDTTDYTTSLDTEFSLNSYCDSANYSPYSNVDGALALQQSLSDQVACMIGIPIYYFKANGQKGSADMTFKEYALKSIESVKQIKLIVGDGTMPSSKPEFSELGLDWQTDWQTEISKSQFATAFGMTAQPMEGDLIYIPLMKRMWMVNEAYDERNGAFMWQSTTWQVFLTKYQADASMDLNDHEDFVNELVKNKYDDLFGDTEPLDSGQESVGLTTVRPANMYSVYKSDSTRKEMTCDSIDFVSSTLYHKGTLIADNFYSFASDLKTAFVDGFPPTIITYQRPYCGDSASISFIIKVHPGHVHECDLFTIGHNKIQLKQGPQQTEISCSLVEGKTLTIENDKWFFICIRWSKQLRTFDMTAAVYTYPENIPLYKLSNYHYYFDVDHAQTVIGKWNTEFTLDSKHEFVLNGFYGNIANIKLMDVYNQNTSEMMMQYPTNSHLLINDTARPLVGLLGTEQK